MRAMLPSLMALLCVMSTYDLRAASPSSSLADVELSHESENLKRGAQFVLSMCTGCHNLTYVKYRELLRIGFNHQEVAELKGDNDINAPIFSPDIVEMTKSLFGLVPPDLSLIAKAREGKGRYIYTLLTSYHQNEDGSVDNSVFPGIRMPDVLSYSSTTDDQDRKVLEEQARDAAVFLEWTADPHANDRRTMGYYVMGYLIVFTFLLWFLKRRTWSQLEGK